MSENIVDHVIPELIPVDGETVSQCHVAAVFDEHTPKVGMKFASKEDAYGF
jgi:hypothetical protein